MKEFARWQKGYDAWAQRQHTRDVVKDMNAWFAELAADDARAYDIRQILERADGSILVFYEVAPVE